MEIPFPFLLLHFMKIMLQTTHEIRLCSTIRAMTKFRGITPDTIEFSGFQILRIQKTAHAHSFIK